MGRYILLLFSFFYTINAIASDNPSCGYQTCHPIKDGALNVHIVPHSHDDVGWLKTVDQYYYGARTNIQSAGVQYILDSVVEELLKDANRRFVYVETAFFSKWYMQQNDHRRHLLKRLVNEGRLEFAGGAWSMNDEAVTHYQSVVDQITWGLRFLNETFGACGRPKVVWQIDPFGHSREMANLWAQVGYDGLFLGRVDYQDKQRRLQDKEAEMIWFGRDDSDPNSNLFTGVLYNHYAPPPGFCFDTLCDDDPIIDDKKSPEYNVDKMVAKFISYANNQSINYKTNNIIMTMGEDFFYQNAMIGFKNMDKLIKYVNAHDEKINLIYSTPSCYLKALHDSKLKWPTKSDDFFPYASDEQSFWTGYFTSRPAIKFHERRGNNFLQVCKQLYAMANLNERDKVDLNMLRTAMGVMQHHDAVTGTEQQHVANDYSRMLENGIQDCLITSTEALNILMTRKQSDSKVKKQATYLPMTLCALNETRCDVTETSKHFVITVYNPLAHIISEYVRIPVTGEKYIIRDPSGTEMQHQIASIPENLINQLPLRKSKAKGELIFLAENLPPLGYRSYYIQEIDKETIPLLSILKKKMKKHYKSSITNIEEEEEMMADEAKTPIIIDKKFGPLKFNANINKQFENIFSDKIKAENSIANEYLTLTINPNSGLVENVEIKGEVAYSIPLTQKLMYYEGMPATNSSTNNRPSGAYIFRPQSSNPKEIGTPTYVIRKGPLVEELHQTFSNWATQIIRIYKGQKHIEFEWLIGPIPIQDGVGKEIISQFTTNLKTNGLFYTDSNGRQMIKREINKRPSWNLNLKEPISGNYYPITSMISIMDNVDNKGLYILTDRAQGGSSLNDGQVELMLHRRLLYDDGFGVTEPLNETVNGMGLVVKGTHYLFLGTNNDSKSPLAVQSRQMALQKLLQPAIFITPADNITFEQWNSNKNEFSGTNAELPGNVHVLTLEPWRDSSILLRLEHFIDLNDNKNDLSKDAIVNLRILLSDIKIISVREATLGANQWRTELNRLDWNSAEKETDIKITFNENIIHTVNDDLLVTLKPMEIRTFIIKATFNI